MSATVGSIQKEPSTLCIGKILRHPTPIPLCDHHNVPDNYLERPGRRNVLIADSFDDDEAGLSDDDRDHRTLDRRNRTREEEDAIRIAREYKERHRQRRSGGGMGSQMADFAPKSVLMPSVNDPSIWCVKCKVSSSMLAWYLQSTRPERF